MRLLPSVSASGSSRAEGCWASLVALAVREGSLALCGVPRPLTVRVTRVAGRLVFTATVHQPTRGLSPYQAILGALRVKPDVQVDWSLAGM